MKLNRFRLRLRFRPKKLCASWMLWHQGALLRRGARRKFLDALAPRIYFHFNFLFYFRNFSYGNYGNSFLKTNLG